ncbi:hypothetical protein Leryth_001783 [Lithospermum erythrorhizon]|nr:hypothetical protein Leryth_001783 [Lithospermum erythrorhizon]
MSEICWWARRYRSQVRSLGLGRPSESRQKWNGIRSRSRFVRVRAGSEARSALISPGVDIVWRLNPSSYFSLICTGG